jgi:TPR repeat protein
MVNIENHLNAAIAALKCGDTDTAFTLFKLVTEGNSPVGQHFLDWCFKQGIGVEKDDKAAFEL